MTSHDSSTGQNGSGRSDDASLSSGDLAERTGVAAPTLRMWEQRHGFPSPVRHGSGHRRYTEADVLAVRDVMSRRASGVHLEAAIEQVVEALGRREGPASVYAELLKRHPQLRPHRLRKSTLIGLSHAMEDEFRSGAQRAILFGSFQEPKFWHKARRRWDELARVSRAAYVFADFDDDDTGPLAGPANGGTPPVLVGLDPASPMHSEWAIVFDADGLTMVLAAWELPTDQDLPDADRVFEAVWSVSPQVVRDAARVCAEVARRSGAAGADATVQLLADEPVAGTPDFEAMTALFARVVDYVDSSPPVSASARRQA